MALRKIELEDGKYTILHHEEHGGVTVLRHGEPWRNETGDKLLLAMIDRIESLEEDSRRLNALESWGVDNWSGYDDALAHMKDKYDN